MSTEAALKSTPRRNGILFADNFYQNPFAPAAVEFAVENLFPRAEIQFPFRDRHDDFAAHDLAFQVRVSVVFAGAVVMVLLLLQPKKRPGI